MVHLHAVPSGDEARPRPDDLFDAVMESLSEGVIIADQGGFIRSVNRAVEEIFGYGKSELEGQHLALLVPGGGQGSDPAAGDWRELEGRRKDGSAFPMEVRPGRQGVGRAGMQVTVVRDITEHKRIAETVQDLTLNDPLTGLANRNLFRRRLEDALQNAERRGRLVALMLLDVAGFKSINDHFGHSVGDALLIEVSERLKAVIRKVDTVARLDGDEFGLVLVDLENMEAVRGLAERVIDGLSQDITLDGCLLRVGASVGISFFPRDDTSPDELVRKADYALCEAKEAGRGAYRFYQEAMNAQARSAKALETDLRLALVREEFLLHYQPMLSVDGCRVVGAEALIRWQHPTRGLVPPGEFIPVAEASEVMVPLGEWVLRTACAQNVAWQAAGMPPLKVAVNICARQFRDGDFLAMLRKVLHETGLDPRCLELEITEGVVMDDIDQVVRKFHVIDDLGIEISIDDFGTGYSSLAYLKRFPVHRLKIDRSFVRDVTTDPDDAAITEAVISMGHSLNLKVLAEGVETEDQVAFLRTKGCDELQGFLFSRPLEAEGFLQWFESWSRLEAV